MPMYSSFLANKILFNITFVFVNDRMGGSFHCIFNTTFVLQTHLHINSSEKRPLNPFQIATCSDPNFLQ